MESKNEMDILLSWLSPDREEVEHFYMVLRRKLVLMFRSFNDPEDLADETIAQALNNIRDGKVADFSGNPSHYIFKIARRVKLQKFREKKTLPLDKGIKEPMAEAQNNRFPEELYQITEKCLEGLPAKDKELFLDYTFPPENISAREYREQLEEKWNISATHLRVKIHRIKILLRKRILEMEQKNVLSEKGISEAEQKNVLPKENDLLHKINTIFSVHERQRYNELYAKFQQESLTGKEQAELQKLSDKFEILNAKRLEYLGKLAKLRGQSLREVIKDLGIKP